VFFIQLLVELVDALDELAQDEEVLFPALDLIVHDDAIKTLLGRLANQFFREGDVFLGGKAEAINNLLHAGLGFLNAPGDFHFLFAGEERDLTHLPEVHANGVIENIEAGFILLFIGFRLLNAVNFSLIHNIDFQIAELGANFLQRLGCDGIAGEGVVDIAVGEVTLLLGETDEFLYFFGEIQTGSTGGRCVIGAVEQRRLRMISGFGE